MAYNSSDLLVLEVLCAAGLTGACTMLLESPYAVACVQLAERDTNELCCRPDWLHRARPSDSVGVSSCHRRQLSGRSLPRAGPQVSLCCPCEQGMLVSTGLPANVGPLQG